MVRSTVADRAARGATRGALRLIAIAVLCCSAASSGPAAAQSRGDDSRRREAAQHFERGVALAEEARWNDAIRELEAARDLRPTPSVMFNLGMAYRAVGRTRDAIATFGAYLAADPAIPAATRTQVERLVREMLPSLARLAVRVEPSDATISVDGVALAPGTTEEVLDPGRHTVAASADGYQTVTRAETFSPGEVTHVELVLIPSIRVCRLYVDTTLSDSVIRIDGRAAAPGHADEFLDAGVHDVEVSAPGRRTVRRLVTLAAGQAVRITMDPPPERTLLQSPWFWGGAGVVVAGIVVGGFLIATGVEPVSGLGYPVCVGCTR